MIRLLQFLTFRFMRIHRQWQQLRRKKIALKSLHQLQQNPHRPKLNRPSTKTMQIQSTDTASVQTMSAIVVVTSRCLLSQFVGQVVQIFATWRVTECQSELSSGTACLLIVSSQVWLTHFSFFSFRLVFIVANVASSFAHIKIGRKETPICLPLPGGFTNFCGRIYGISKKNEDFKACLGLELRADEEVEAALRVSCFSFGPKGLKVMEAEPIPVSAPVEEEDGKDFD